MGKGRRCASPARASQETAGGGRRPASTHAEVRAADTRKCRRPHEIKTLATSPRVTKDKNIFEVPTDIVLCLSMRFFILFF